MKAALALEDLSIRAYNAGAPNLSDGALRSAATIASVEVRHAAWVRDLAKENPAPDASEPVLTPDDVTAAIRKTGYIR